MQIQIQIFIFVVPPGIRTGLQTERGGTGLRAGETEAKTGPKVHSDLLKSILLAEPNFSCMNFENKMYKKSKKNAE